MPRLLVNRVAGNLRHPLFGWMARNAGQGDTPGLEMQKEQNVVGGQATPSQHFYGEKINPSENRHVRGDELLPSRAPARLRRWRDAITAQDIPHSLVGDNVTQIGQCAYDPVIAPAKIFASHANDEVGHLTPDLGPPWIGSVLGTIELLSDKPAVPGKNSVGLGDGNLPQRFPAEPFADFS